MVVAAAATAPTQTSTTGLPSIVPPEPLLEQPGENADDPKETGLGPGSLLPKVGQGLDVAVGFRFGVGTDATDSIRADPPYAAVIDFRGTVQRRSWYAAAHWGVQIAGPEANPPEKRIEPNFSALGDRPGCRV